MFGFLKRLLGRLLSLLTFGLLGSRKGQNAYYLELDGSQAADSSQQGAAPASSAAQQSQPTGTASASSSGATVQSAAVPSQVGGRTQPAAQRNEAAANVGNFAPKYWRLQPSMDRRRPGPSLDSFRELARQTRR